MGAEVVPKIFDESCLDFLDLSTKGRLSDMPTNIGIGKSQEGDGSRLDVGRLEGSEAIAEE